MKTFFERYSTRWAFFRPAALFLASVTATALWAAPFDKQFDFTQPDGTRVHLHGKGDEFSAHFETLDGSTVVFDQNQRAYCLARQDTNGHLISTEVQVQRADPTALASARGIRMSDAARRQLILERYQQWELGMQTASRWQTLKAVARARLGGPGGGPAGTNGPLPSPPPFTTTGLKVGLTLLIDFSDVPATIPQSDVVAFCNDDNYTGYGNNGSVKQYYYDNSNGLLTYTNVVTIYIRVPQPKTYYNDITKAAGAQGNLLVKDALDALKALPNYTTQILPTFDALTVDNNNQVVACNVFFAGDNSGVWLQGLWPHSWALYNVGAQELSPGGKQVWRYQITDIGNSLSIGTFCHENGHMLCGYPDLYDYQYDSTGGAGNFSLMAYGNFDHNPVQIDAYLKRASGWATTTDLDFSSFLRATVSAPNGPNFNHFYRFQKPGVPTEYYLVENRQRLGHDALIPGTGVAIWHVDELGDRDNQSLVYNTDHANYELTLVQADNLWHFERYINAGDSRDLYYAANPAPGYQNEFSDSTAPSARWWDGSDSSLLFADFSDSLPNMTFTIGSGGPLVIQSKIIAGGNGNGVIDPNECNSFSLVLTNIGFTDVTHIHATLSSDTPEVAIIQPDSDYPNIPAYGSAANLSPFRVSTSPWFICGTPVDFTLLIKSDQVTLTNTFTIPTGTTNAPLRFDNSVPLQIADGLASGVFSPIVVSNISSALKKVTVSLFISHPLVSDLRLALISPDGTTNLLSANAGGFSGSDYGLACFPDSLRTTFDDDAGTNIAAGLAPFQGAFSPAQPLSVFNGKSGTNVNGIWQLQLVDQFPGLAGMLQCWSLSLTPATCTDGGGECPGTDLALGMTALPNPVIQGNNLTYNLSATNNGPNTVTNLTVTQLLPSGSLFLFASSSQGTYSLGSGILTFNLGTLRPRASVSMSVVVMVQPFTPSSISSTASVTSEQPDFNPLNNSVTLISTVIPPTADLSVTMIGSPGAVLAGAPITYTVTAANNGPSSASPVTVTNHLLGPVTLSSAANSQGSFLTADVSTILWTIPALDAGARATATFVVVPFAEGSVSASAVVGAPQFDPLLANNSASVTTPVAPAADLVITLTNSPNPVVARSNVTYTVTVTNLGPSLASGIVANVALPASVSVLSSSPSYGSVSVSTNIPPTATWTVPSLATNAGATLILGAAAPDTGNNYVTINASATVLGAQPDPVTANNVASTSTLVAPPFINILPFDLDLVSESGPVNGALDIGETVGIQFHLFNAGNSATKNLLVTLLTGGGVTNITSPNPAAFHIRAGEIEKPAPPPFVFTATADGVSNHTLVATLHLQDDDWGYSTNVSFFIPLPVLTNFANSAPIIIPNPVNPDPPYPPESGPAAPYPSIITVANLSGFLGKVTVTLSNLSHTYPADIDALLVAPNGAAKAILMSRAGDQPVQDISLTFDDSSLQLLPDSGQLPSGAFRPAAYDLDGNLQPPSFNPDPSFPPAAPSGPYSAVLTNFIGINPNGSWSLYINDNAWGDAGAISNGWSLALTMLTRIKNDADLGIAVAALPNPVHAGSPLTCTFTITNAGPDRASFITFTNPFPLNAAFVSVSSSRVNCSTNGDSVFGSLTNLNAGAAATVTVVYQPANTGSLAISGSVASSSADLFTGNNSASTSVTVYPASADVALSFSSPPDPATVAPGSNVTFVVSVANLSPFAALGLTITNPLPAGVSFLSSSPSQGAVTNSLANLTWTIPSLAPFVSASNVVVFQAKTSFLGTISNRAGVFLTNLQTDPNLANNSALATAQVAPRSINVVLAGSPSLTFESGPVNGIVDPGEHVTARFQLQNLGTISCSNLVVTLLAANGVSAPSPASINYPLLRNGASVSPSFSFTSSPVNGGTVIATLQLQEAGGYSTNLSFAFAVAANPSNPGPIAIPDHGPAFSYPSTITVSDLAGSISKVTVTLSNLTHSFPRDINALLVSPAGSNVLLMSHAGYYFALTNVTLTFDDAGPLLPPADRIVTGTYKPSAYPPSVSFPVPAPSDPSSYASALSAFSNTAPNGTWSLYLLDDANGDSGALASGWCLSITTVNPLSPVTVLAAMQPYLTGSLASGKFMLTIAAKPDTTHTIQYSTNLLDWLPLTTATADSSGLITLTNNLTSKACFYRTIQTSP